MRCFVNTTMGFALAYYPSTKNKSIKWTSAFTALIHANSLRSTTNMLGIKEQGFEQVKIYPNRAKGVINISGADEGSVITVYSIQG